MKIIEKKPENALKGIADDTGKTMDEVNALWDKALKELGKTEDELSGEDYGALIGKVKDAAGVKGDVDSETSGKNTSESVYDVKAFLESTKTAKEFLA